MLVILSGVSGAGKDTIKKELIKRMPNIVTLPSFTSRDMRLGEVEGDHYHFISKEEFEEKIRKGDFYEFKRKNFNKKIIYRNIRYYSRSIYHGCISFTILIAK